MKKYILLLPILLLNIALIFSQNKAKDFTVNDCNGQSRSLFTELGNGKIIVFAFVMPCSSCIPASVSAYNSVQSFATSHPGRVLFYMADDYANTACATVSNWAKNNGMPNAIVFSNSAVNMLDYGAAGMPKIVAVGGTDGTVLYTEDGTLNATNLKNAITTALNATGVKDNLPANFQPSLFPNPIRSEAKYTFSLSQNSMVNISVFNILGENVQTVLSEKRSGGKNEVKVDCENLKSGVYFLKMQSTEGSDIMKFTVAK